MGVYLELRGGMGYAFLGIGDYLVKNEHGSMVGVKRAALERDYTKVG